MFPQVVLFMLGTSFLWCKYLQWLVGPIMNFHSSSCGIFKLKIFYGILAAMSFKIQLPVELRPRNCVSERYSGMNRSNKYVTNSCNSKFVNLIMQEYMTFANILNSFLRYLNPQYLLYTQGMLTLTELTSLWIEFSDSDCIQKFYFSPT